MLFTPPEELPDTRPLDEVTFVGDLSTEEKRLVMARAKVEDAIRVALSVVVTEKNKVDKEGNPLPPDYKLIQEKEQEAKERMEVVAEFDAQIQPYAEERAAQAADVRKTLKEAGLKVAQDIVETGCTGLFGKLGSIEAVKEIRERMGGSGVGLPCYVGCDRYCLVHQTIGGLQENQVQKFPEFILGMSRELTERERNHFQVVEHARRQRGDNRINRAHDLLQEAEEAARAGVTEIPGAAVSPVPAPSPSLPAPVPDPPDMTELFKCQEHGQLFWGCRFCVAQAVVEGDLEPLFHVHADLSSPLSDRCAGAEVEQRIEELNATSTQSMDVYVRAAHFRRKLARDT